MNSHQLINQDSGNTEWYTPNYILDAARAVLGSIKLDPASCAAANRFVQSERYYTAPDDGLSQPWRAKTVWMNHPYSREGNRHWPAKLLSEYQRGNIGQALAIVNASTSERWFQPLMQYPLAFLHKRVRFVCADGNEGKSPTKGSAIVYCGQNVDKFVDVFDKLGSVMLPARIAE